ncbi:hypothetical protein [Cytobacillus firmus]|uniref:hypothetical protein n=1 Tax=Cytobacillus firmus TaxID=1399 RepID=UPI0018CE02AB|nr:hypothetical protein [Cytobacillus firmus]MBG9587066.1 hypothetical protein [Cytobacillus firmus]
MSNTIINHRLPINNQQLLNIEIVISELKKYDLVQINDIFCIPEKEEIVRSKRNNKVKQVNRIYYPIKVKLENSNTMCYLRSFGADFNIVLFDWIDLKAPPKGFFSIGKGVANGIEVKSLLLAQFYGEPMILDDISKNLSKILKQRSNKFISIVDSQYDLPCLKVSAVI